MAQPEMTGQTTPPIGDPLAARSVDLLRERFGADVREVIEYRGETTVVVEPARIVDVCMTLRDAPDLRYNFFVDLTAVDWLDRVPRFDVVYHLLSIETKAVLRLKARIGDEGEEHPHIATITSVWQGANWFEREVYDLFGIFFDGHPDMRRIMMPDDWVSHPLRKDYPLTGFTLPDPHWGGQVPFGSILQPGTGAQTLRTPGGTPGMLDDTDSDRQRVEGQPEGPPTEPKREER